LRELLDASTQRLIRMLETLSSQDDWMTIPDLSAVVGASERTVAEDVDRMSKRWGHYLDIEISARKGVRIHRHSTAVLSRILADLFNECTALRFLEELLLFPHRGTEFYEERLFVSRSTLTRLLPRINKYLATRGMAVLRRNNLYRLVAEDELHLRVFFTAFLVALNGADLSRLRLPFDFRVPQAVIQRIFARRLRGPALDFAVRDELTGQYHGMFYFVSLLRENQGYCVCADYDIQGEVTEAELSYFRRFFPRVAARNLSPIHKFILDSYNGWSSEEEKARISRETEAFWNGIFTRVHHRPDDGVMERLHMAVYATYFSARHRPYPKSKMFDRVGFFALSLRRHNEPFYRLVETSLAALSERIGLDLSPRLSDLLFWMFLIFPGFGDFAPQKTALVVSDFGAAHAGFLAEYVSRFFNAEGRPPALKAVPARCSGGWQLSDVQDFDFVITTVPGVAAEGKKTILVNDFPSRENMCEIYKTLMQV